MNILHHGAVGGVTGSCHELRPSPGDAILIDCGLFQGAERSGRGSAAEQLAIDFPIDDVRALIVTHVHIDHVGRIPYLLAAGYGGPIYCTPPSAQLLPLVLEDALKIGVTRNRALIRRVMAKLARMIRPVPFGQWQAIDVSGEVPLAVQFGRAGHILGSAWVDCRVGAGDGVRHAVFSGDLGNQETPLLRAPEQPGRADVLVLESTYGDRNHDGREQRRERLQEILQQALRDRGTVLIPAFSIGRTQELLYEIEGILYENRGQEAVDGLRWEDIDIVLDSPMAADFTDVYRALRPYWDEEARALVRQGRHPLDFDQLTTIDSHEDHISAVNHLAGTERPAVVLAASGMCAGGRIVNYLKAMLGNPKHDILFVGYQAAGTPGRVIQRYGPGGGYVDLDGERFDIRARVHSIAGYSAHADQQGLVAFAAGVSPPPQEIRLIHGDPDATSVLADVLQTRLPDSRISIPTETA